MKGYVYILTNPSMPGIVKIGRTSRSVDGRAAELYQTGVPLPFVVETQVFSPDCVSLERSVHDDMAKLRLNGGREFFRSAVEDAECVLIMRHEEIVSQWLSEFMPDRVLLNETLAPDYPHINRLSEELDVAFMDAFHALQMVEADELRPALVRWRSVIQRRNQERVQTANIYPIRSARGGM